MSGSFDIGKYILEQLKSGSINKDAAFTILKNLKNVNESASDDVAIIGMACKLPKANNADEYWSNIIGGLNCIGDFPESRRGDTDKLIGADSDRKSSDYYFKAGYLEEIDKFDAAFFRIPPAEARLMDPYQRLLLETVWESIEDAGYGGDLLSDSKTGVYIGADHSFRVLMPSYSQISTEAEMLNMTGSWTSILSSRISYAFNLKGPSIVVDTACSSGLVALHLACKALKNGDCDMAIAGSINLIILPTKNNLFSSVESYGGVVRTFDKTADGTTWAEGVGTLVIKPLKKAIQDGDSIYAIIKGSAINNDGLSNGITAPSAQAQEDVIVRAWQEAKIDPETISYVESHGTATVLGDPIEIKGLSDAFRRYTGKKQFCAIGTVKTNIAHTVSTSGIAGVIKVVKAFQNNKIPATRNFVEPNPYANFVETPLYVSAKPIEWPKGDVPRRAGVSAFGFSGTNCHVLLEEAPDLCKNDNNEDSPYIFVLSAKSQASLEEMIRNYLKLFEIERSLSLKDICYTAAIGRGHYSYRIAIIAKDLKDLKDKFTGLNCIEMSNTSLSGAYFGYHKLVSSNKQDRQENEITESERHKLSSEANSTLQSYSTASYKDQGMLEKICELFVKGADIKWSELYKGSNARKLHLPTYAFERNRYWLSKMKDMKNKSALRALPQCYEVHWKQSEPDNHANGETFTGAMVFKSEDHICSEVIRCLKDKGVNIIEVSIGEEFRKINDKEYLIDGSEESYKNLLKEARNSEFTKIIHLATVTRGKEADTLNDLEQALKNGVYSLLYLAKAIKECNVGRNLDIVLVSENSSEVTKNELKILPENAAFFGVGKAVVIENSDIRCRCVDIDEECSYEQLIREIEVDSEYYQVAFRNGKRYVELMKETELTSYKDGVTEIDDGDVYVITGGMGGLGLELAKYITRYKRVKLAMINRSKMPERSLWDEILNIGEDKNLCKKILTIREIESTGSKVELYSADLADLEQMEAVVKSIKETLGGINGIFHCAGTTKKNILINKTDKDFKEVLLSKVQGTWVLDRVTRDEKPRFFVMFSSVSSLFGFPGQGDYTTANSYLDSYCGYRNKKGLKTLSINWTTWRDVGMVADTGMNADGTFKSISTSEALDMLTMIFRKDITRIVAGEINYSNLIFQGDFIKTVGLSSEIKLKINKEKFKPDESTVCNDQVVEKSDIEIKGRTGKDYNDIEDKLARIWAAELEMDTIDIYDNFHDMGGDSIMAGGLLEAINKEYPGIVSVTDLFLYPSIIQMAEYIGSKIGIDKSNIEQKEKEPEEEYSEDRLKELIKGLKNGDSAIEDALDILEKVRFSEDD